MKLLCTRSDFPRTFTKDMKYEIKGIKWDTFITIDNNGDERNVLLHNKYFDFLLFLEE